MARLAPADDDDGVGVAGPSSAVSRYRRVGTVVAGGIVLLRYHASPRGPFERRPVVVNVYTEPRHRRQGLARRLMETMIEWSRAQRFSSLYPHASTDGRALYEPLGFEPTNEMRLDLRRG